jgi:prepilin-type processing-associated H-X9-DG protein
MTFASIIDGSSNSFAFGEISWNGMEGANPFASAYQPGYNLNWQAMLRSWHRGCYTTGVIPVNTARLINQSSKAIAADRYINAGLKALRLAGGPSDTDTNYLNMVKLYNSGTWGSNHPGGTHFTYADGSVHFLSETISTNIFVSTGSCNGGENAL